MVTVIELPIADWNQPSPPAVQDHALHALEEGNILLLPQLGFLVQQAEGQLFSAATAAKQKNISFDITTATLRGTSLMEAAAEPLRAMMLRFARCSENLALNLLPRYRAGLALGRTSFRPVDIAGRSTSWRKDDSRVHVDSFPSSPTQGRRILRLFTNVDPEGRSRSWRLGESFPTIAGRYQDSLSGPRWGSSQLLRLLRITRKRRSPYDHFMLQLHDRMKADSEYQSAARQTAYEFPVGSTWIAFTDQVSHAATAGQHLLEQTFYLPVSSMADPSKSPLRILERLTGRELT
jgi:3-deoxy-D-manno-octulosonic acid hydroxylase-like protein